MANKKSSTIGSDVKTDFRDAMHGVQEGFSDLRENIGECSRTALETTKHHLQEGVDTVRHAAGDLLDNTSRQIRNSPMTSVLVAVGIGFLTGYLISRR